MVSHLTALTCFLVLFQHARGYTTSLLRRSVKDHAIPRSLRENRPFNKHPLLHRQWTHFSRLQTSPINADDATPSPSFRQKIPTILTVARCAAIPLLLWTFYRGPVVTGSVSIFVLASLTDLLDGYLARKWNATSDFGAFLDPVADKLMVAAVLLPLAGKYGSPVAIPATLIIMREIGVSALREWMASQQVRNVVKVGFLGKVKTMVTMASLTLFLLEPMFPGVYKTSLALMWLCSLVTVWSGALYFFAALPYF